MDTKNFDRFKHVIARLTEAELAGEKSLYAKLTIERDGPLQICYAPFEHVNERAKLVIVGITPGKTQMLKALHVAKECIEQGIEPNRVVHSAKAIGSFSGPMRPLLVSMLNHVGIHRHLGVRDCEDFFQYGAASGLLHSTSILRNPVFVNGENYNGTPKMLNNPMLRAQIMKDFAKDVEQLKDPIYVPLGDKVAEALFYLADRCVIKRSRILDGLPHPSPANIERIQYFLGNKKAEDLSSKTNARKIDLAKAALIEKLAAL